MDPLTITRSVEIEAPVDRVWDAVGTVEGLGGWLGLDGHLRLDGPDGFVPGAAGRLVEADGTARRLVLTEVAGPGHGARVGFTWWSDDRPEEASSVVITVEPSEGDGTARVTVTETIDPALVELGGRGGAGRGAVAAADVADLLGHWDLRLGALDHRCSPVAVGLGA